MIKQQHEHIDGKQYTVTQFPAMRGFPIFLRFWKIVGPALAAMQAVNPNAEATWENLAPAIAGAFRDLDVGEATSFAVELLSGTSTVANGERLALDNETAINGAFGANLLTMFKVLAFAARVNFGDFFVVGGELVAPRATPGVTTSKE